MERPDVTVTREERMILRELAKRQAEIAALPEMVERRNWWYDLNDGKTGRPLVTMEFHGLARDVYPPPACENEFAKTLEWQMSQLIFKHEHYRDDRVIPGSIMINVQNRFTPFGYKFDSYHADSAGGAETLGYMYTHPVNDLEADFGVFAPSTYYVDVEFVKSNYLKACAEEILGDILPVRLQSPAFNFGPAGDLIRMMSMETMFCSIMDYPNLFHKVMRRITDDCHAYMDAIEAADALLPNNDESNVPMDTYGYTHDLPGIDASAGGRPIKFCDTWGYGNSQETVGMSVAMFDEFFFSYVEEIFNRFGLISYGCCEPVHTLWDRCLSRLKNIRKVSISAWCNEEMMGEALRGKKVVYQRKPFPNLIAVDSVFDEAAFLKHMERTCRAARGCPLEVTFRDVTSVRGEPRRLTRAVELTREAFDKYWQG